MAIKLLIFDVNETLLDLRPLKDSINKALENEWAFEMWFPQLLHYSLVETITENYKDFSEIGAATLKMTAEKLDKTFSEKEIEEILSPIKKLNAYPDVKEGLQCLKSKGYTIAALSNGKPEVLKNQLEFAGISDLFDAVFSVEKVKRYKPHKETYNNVLHILNVIPENAILIAAHGWDIIGGQRAGLKTAFIKRPGKSKYPLALAPNYEVSTILELVTKLEEEK